MLTLHPGEGREGLHGSLSDAPLNSNTSYEALSYAWGSSDKPYKLFLPHNQHLPITASLRSALLRLRKPHSARRLWIDALCINQADEAEKSGQVRLMNRVYNLAERVLCWLGEETPNGYIGRAMRFLQRLRRLRVVGERRPLSRMEGERLKLPKQNDVVWHSLLYLFDLPWFRRCWIVQEFVVGREVLFLYGGAQVDWRRIAPGVSKLNARSMIAWGTQDHLAGVMRQRDRARAGSSAFELLTNLRYSACLGDFHELLVTGLEDGAKTIEDLRLEHEVSPDPRLASFLHQFDILPKHIALRVQQDFVRAYRAGEHKGTVFDRKPPRFSLPYQINLFAHSSASDPRDKLLAFVGLSTKVDDPSLQPNYSESVTEVYTRFARHFITDAHDLEGINILALAGISWERLSSLPSWVPDCSQEALERENVLARRSISGHCYHAGGPRPARVRLTDAKQRINLAAGRIDIVTHLVEFPQWKILRDDSGQLASYFELDDMATEEQLMCFAEDMKDDVLASPDLAQSIHRYFNAADEPFRQHTNPYPKAIPGEPKSEIQWRTLIAGAPPHSNARVLEHSYSAFRRRLAGIATGEDDNESIRDWLGEWGSEWLALSYQLGLFGSATGLLGMAPRGTAVGDEIWVVRGVKLPLVLRPVENKTGSYTLIGGCYVHGIMQGEILEDADWKEQEICLV